MGGSLDEAFKHWRKIMNDSLREKFIRERLDEHPFGSFDRIPLSERLHPDRFLCGCLKIASLMEDPSKFNCCTEGQHDIIFLPTPHSLSDEDVRYLVRCGFHFSQETEGLAYYT